MMRSSLAKFQPSSSLSADEIYKLQKQMIDEGRGVMFTDEQLKTLPMATQLHIESAAKQLFGRKKHG